MTQTPARHIDRFADLPVLVLGEAMLDSYLEGAASRLCPEAPAPVVALTGRRDAPGGAANTALNVRRLGARAVLLSVVGDDAEAGVLRHCLEGQGAATEHLLTQPGRRTLAKHRVCAAGQILVRYDQGDGGPVNRATEEELIARLNGLFPTCAAVIVSDYGYGVLTPRVIAALAALQARSPRVVAVDSKRLAAFRVVGPTVAKANYAEALALLGLSDDGPREGRVERTAARGGRFLEATGARIAAVTLDADGAVVFERGRPPHRTYARPRPACRTSGAGDTYVATLALALAAGAEAPEAAELASAAAAVVVGKDGTASCSTEELRVAIGADAPAAVGRARLAAELEEHRRLGRRIVFTNGCFDILHRGHVTYLSRRGRWATCWSSASTPTTASAASRDRAGRSTRSKTVSPSSPRSAASIT